MSRFYVVGWMLVWSISWIISLGAISLLAQDPPHKVPKGSATASKAARELLGKRVEQLLSEQAFPALQQGYGDYFFAAVAPVIERMDSDELQAMDELAKDQGIDSLRGEFAKLLIQRIEQGVLVLTEVEKPELAIYIVDGVVTSVHSQMEEIAELPVMSDKLNLPEPGQPTEDLFWDVHVLSNRFENLHRLAAYAQTLAAPHLSKAIKADDTNRIGQLEGAMKLTVDVTKSYRHLLLNAAEYRLMDLDRAVTKLRVTADFEQRLLAAWALEDNAQLLLELLSRAKPEELTRESLSSPGLQDHVTDQLRLGLEYGKDVVEKARLLRLGCFWWLRGRYGAGPLANGLLKDVVAMESEEKMFGLYMPVRPRKAVSSFLPEEDRLPGFDRRHFQTWSVEYRPRVSHSGTRQTGAKRDLAVNNRQLGETTTFW